MRAIFLMRFGGSVKLVLIRLFLRRFAVSSVRAKTGQQNRSFVVRRINWSETIPPISRLDYMHLHLPTPNTHTNTLAFTLSALQIQVSLVKGVKRA